MPIRTGPCTPWPLTPDCCPALDTADPERVERLSMVATQLLWAASGRRWGPSCPYEIRPCRKSCMDSSGLFNGPYLGAPWIPYVGSDGQWRNASPCGCASDCSCGELCEIRLEGPVHDIVSVNEGGTILPAAAYRVDNGNRLVRTDGNCWPSCQDLAAAPGEPDTLTVTYRVGLPLDAAAIWAYSSLVCHLVKSCGDGCGCGIANRPDIRRMTRQGVTQEFDSEVGPDGLIIPGRFNIREVDQWIALTNPHGLPAPMRVLSPDYKPARVTTWRS